MPKESWALERTGRLEPRHDDSRRTGRIDVSAGKALHSNKDPLGPVSYIKAASLAIDCCTRLVG